MHGAEVLTQRRKGAKRDRMNAELRRVAGFAASIGLMVIFGCAAAPKSDRQVIELYLPPVEYAPAAKDK